MQLARAKSLRAMVQMAVGLCVLQLLAGCGTQGIAQQAPSAYPSPAFAPTAPPPRRPPSAYPSPEFLPTVMLTLQLTPSGTRAYPYSSAYPILAPTSLPTVTLWTTPIQSTPVPYSYPGPVQATFTAAPIPTPTLYPDMYTAAIKTYFDYFKPNVSVQVAYIRAEPGVPDTALQQIAQHLAAAHFTLVAQEQPGELVIGITAAKQDQQVATVGYPADTPTIGISTYVSGNVMSGSGVGYALIQHQSGWEAVQYVTGIS